MIGFVVNPVAGNGKGKRVWSEVELLLSARNVEYVVRFTQATLDGDKMAAELASDPSITVIVAVGGDGTMHEAASGLWRTNSDKLFGYIPAGSGNDFAYGFSIPTDPAQALQVILDRNNTVQADLLRSGDKLAVNSVGIGMDGKIALVTNTAPYKRWMNRIGLGRVAYVLSLVRVLATYKPRDITLTIDGTEHNFSDVWLVAVANIPYYGGGMMICPGAAPTDEIMELCVVSNINRLEILAVFPRVYKGTHTSHRAVQMLRGRQVKLTSGSPLHIHMDGETAGTTPIELEVIPAALKIIIP